MKLHNNHRHSASIALGTSSRLSTTITVVLAMTGSLTLQHAAQAATISRDINTYVLFALDSLHFKGRNVDVTRGFILGGNVGVNRPEPNTNDYLMILGGSSAEVVVSDGTQVVSDSMRLSENFRSQSVNPGMVDLFTNRFDNNTPPPATNYASLTGFVDPIIAPLDPLALLSFTPNRTITNLAVDVTVNNGLSQTLPVADYRDVEVKDDATLTFLAGTYNLRNLTAGKDVTINLTDQTILLIDGEFAFNDDGKIGVGTQGLAQIKAGSLGVGSNDNTIKFSRRTEAHGQFYAPLGMIDLGNHTDLYGRFVAKQIDSDFNVNVTIVHVPEPTAVCIIASAMAGLHLARRRTRSRGTFTG